MSEVQSILEGLPSEVRDGFHGGEPPLPPLLEGCTALVMGCGTGCEAFAASKLAGSRGRVIGVDGDGGKLDVARRHQDEVARTFGYGQSNVEFMQGRPEDLAALGIEDFSVDVVVVNCAFNRSASKGRALSEIYRVLKVGGELCLSSVFADRRIPAALADDPVLRGTCLGGAAYIEDFRRMMRKVGWEDFRYTSTKKTKIDNDEIAEKLEGFTFFTRTVRAFKLPDLLEDLCEQYNQVATYQGTIPGCPEYFDLDDHHRFMANEPMAVCGNSCAMVQATRYGKAFSIEGDRSVHYGPFPGCGNIPYSSDDDEDCGCSTGCC